MNAIEITKQVGVLLEPISLKKDEQVRPFINKVKTLTLNAEHLTRKYTELLTERELTAITCFIHRGGLGQESAIKMQNDLWGNFKGSSISSLISAIRKGGWKESEVLWDMYPFGYNPNRNQTSCLS